MVSEAISHLKGGPLMNYVGIDYHKKYSVVTAIDEEGHGGALGTSYSPPAHT